jgi:ABC-type nitrate/sulfonate/bicarbonate transport system substrate-binding protein
MSKRTDPAVLIALGATVLLTGGLIVGGVWVVNQFAPGLLPDVAGGNGGNPLNPRSSQRITLLGDTFSGYSTFRHAAFQEALAETGIELSYEDEFDQATRAESLSNGQADLIVTTLDQFLQQPDGKIVGLIDRTVGADAVVLNTPQYPTLKSLLDLNQLVQQAKAQGKPLGITFAGDTPSEYLALVLDAKFEAFNLSDFTVTQVADASEAWQLMQDPQQNIAIAIIWEPFVSQARQKGYTVVLFRGDAPGSIVDVIVASNRLLESKPDMVSDLLEAYYRRIDANVRDSSQLQAQIAEDGNLSPTDASAWWMGLSSSQRQRLKPG